jgi:hypothetical protein
MEEMTRGREEGGKDRKRGKKGKEGSGAVVSAG